MPHPLRFRDDDPYLARVRAVCLALPGAAEKISHGRPVFFTNKIFAQFGSMPKGEHWSERFAQSLLVLPDSAERVALLSDSRFFEPAYLASTGWVGLDFRAAEVDWIEVDELIEESYRNTAPAGLVAQLRG